MRQFSRDIDEQLLDSYQLLESQNYYYQVKVSNLLLSLVNQLLH